MANFLESKLAKAKQSKISAGHKAIKHSFMPSAPQAPSAKPEPEASLGASQNHVSKHPLMPSRKRSKQPPFVRDTDSDYA